MNSSDGGATLLKDPKRVYQVVKAVREAVPAHIPVTAKIRLGFADRSSYMDNATAAWQAGASELAVHARLQSRWLQTTCVLGLHWQNSPGHFHPGNCQW